MPDVTPKNILLVDDDEGILRLWGKALEKEGFTVRVARSAEEAVQRLQEEKFSVVFSDMEMPRGGGKDLLRHIKREPGAGCVNIITGMPTVETAVECMHLGACDFITKPCDSKELVAMAYRCMRHYEQVQESKRLKETVVRLEELDKMRSDFVSNVSHELRTPLFSMGAAMDLVFQEIGDKLQGDSQKLGLIIRNNYDRLTKVVGNVLDLARIEQGLLSPEFKKVDLSSHIQSSLRDMSPLFSQRSIERDMSMEICPGASIEADPEHIQRIFVNLIGNAVKFTPRGGKVGASLQDKGDHVLLCVSDTGAGIEKKNHKLIFDRFYQVDGSTTREVGGTGIGLAIVKAMVEMSGGKVWVESEVGKGSQFYVLLPKHQEQKKEELSHVT